LAGFFITLEGIEGSGKSTVARRLVDAFRARGRTVTAAREPGGTAIGERIRSLVLENESADISAEVEALLFTASRAQLVAEVVGPALARGDVVVVDRFVDSTLAYQWGGRGLPLHTLREAQTLATKGLEPNLKLLLDLPVQIGLGRRFADERQMDRIDRESREFHERVHAAYHTLAVSDPQRWRVIDASQSEADVWSEVWRTVMEVEAGTTAISRLSVDP
jgi:dTMP kinase